MGSTICGNAANKNDTIGLVGLDRWDNRVLWIAAVWQNDLFQPLPSVINMITGRHWKNRLELDEKNFFSTMIISDHIHVWLYTNKKKLIKLAVGPSYSSDLVRSDCYLVGSGWASLMVLMYFQWRDAKISRCNLSCRTHNCSTVTRLLYDMLSENKIAILSKWRISSLRTFIYNIKALNSISAEEKLTFSQQSMYI